MAPDTLAARGARAEPARVSIAELSGPYPPATFRADASGEYVYVNARWCELTGLRRPEALGDGWKATVHPDDLDELLARWRRALSGEKISFTYRCCPRGGGVRPVFVQALAARDANGAIVGIAGTLADLSALTETPEENGAVSSHSPSAAAETRERVRAVLLSYDDALISSDVTGRINFWNQAAERLFGYTEREMIGSSSLVLTPPEYLQQALSWKQRLRAGEPLEDIETVRVHKNGRRIDVSFTGFPLRSAGQEIIGTWALIRPRAAQRAGDQLVEELSRRLASIQDDERRRFGRELHDGTGQLLTSLTLTLHTLSTSWQDLTPEVRDALLSDSLALAEEAAHELRTQAFLLHPPKLAEHGLAEAARQFVQAFQERSRLETGMDIDEDLGTISPTVEFIVYRILQESLSNVHRHSQSSSVYLSLRRKGEILELVVRDYGVGFDPATICPGLGLENIKERVGQLGGAFSIKPSPKGTTVFTAVPAQVAGV